jgi:hypothetical protein
MNLITPLEKNLSELAASLPKELYAQIVELVDGFKQAEPQQRKGAAVQQQNVSQK